MEQPGDRSRFVLIVRLPRDIEIRIEDTYLHLASITKPGMGYHITLLGPFYLAPGVAPSALAAIAPLCRSWPPFPVRLSGLSAFRNPDANTVYLRVVNPAEVVALHDALLATVRPHILLQTHEFVRWNVERYRPHVTLGIGLTDAELREFARVAGGRRLEAEFTVGCASLVRQDGNGPWQYVQDYPLADDDEAVCGHAPYPH